MIVSLRVTIYDVVISYEEGLRPRRSSKFVQEVRGEHPRREKTLICLCYGTGGGCTLPRGNAGAYIRLSHSVVDGVDDVLYK